ncbi:hypothetical protein [Moraxella canis]|uniref:hypothetical protein n=1 Tax=Moraxella canis TaxID=90239 RepID=UPI0006694FBE|nr:hypothetical protein [Moraxella canis]
MSDAKMDTKQLFEKAMLIANAQSETPIHQLTRKILNEERKYLFSGQNTVQRRRNIKAFIEEARHSEQFALNQGD